MSSVYLKCRLSISGFWPDFNPANLSRNTSSAENKQAFDFYKNNAIELNKNHLINF